MRTLLWVVGLLAATTLAGTAALEAQTTGTVEIRVVAAETAAPIASVQIVIEGLNAGGLTAADGTLTIRNVPPGTYRISAVRIGTQTITREVSVTSGETLVLDVQLSERAVELNAIDVVTRRTGLVPEASSTAMKLDVPLRLTPQSVTVVTSVQIREQGSLNLQEALRYSPGVRHEVYGIDNRGDWFGLRGSPEATTFLDGMRVPYTGWWGVVRNEPYAFERVDVLLGPASIIAGQNDPGGVLNLVSKRPDAELSREVGFQTGNYGRAEGFADFTGSLDSDGDVLYRLVALGRRTGTQIHHADEVRALVAPSLTWRSANRSVTFFGEYQYDKSGNTNAFLGLQGTLDPAPNGPIPYWIFIGEPDWDRYGGSRYRMGYEAQLGLGNGWTLRHDFRHDRVDGLLKTMYAVWWDGFVDATGTPQPDGEHLGRIWYAEDARSEVTSAELMLTGRQRTGPIEHTLFVGADGFHHAAESMYAEDSATPLNVYNPTYGSVAEPDMSTATPSENVITTFGLLAQDQMLLGAGIHVRLGLRRDFVRNRTPAVDTQEDWATTGNVGVVWDGVGGVAPYASYSESFTPVSGTDADGNLFDPRRAWQGEVGVKWQPESAPLMLSAAVYTITDRNRLIADPDDINYSIQLGEATSRGVELEAKGGIGPLSLLGSYTYNRVKSEAWPWGGEADPDQQMEGFPEHSGSVWAKYDLADMGLTGLSLGGGVRRTGRVGDGTGNVFVPGVTLVDAVATYQRGPWRLAFNANNVTDKLYLATCLARGDCWFGPRRSIQTSLTYQW